MKRTIIKNGKIILPSSIVEKKVLVVKDKKIEAIISENEFVENAEDFVIDAAGKYVSPGFVDLHVHGGGGYDFLDGTAEAFLGVAEAHARFGTTAMQPTTAACYDEELFKAFTAYGEANKKNDKGAKFLGLHLEGPYLSPEKSGAQDKRCLKTPAESDCVSYLNASSDIARISIAPELDGAIELGKELKKRGILPSVAHTNTTYDVIVRAYEAGFTHMTHFYSAMSTVMKKGPFRYAGAVEAGYLIDDMTVEIIADGKHLPIPILQFVYKFKGADKTALCTDAMRDTCLDVKESIIGSRENGIKVIISDGVAMLPDRSALASSIATTNRLVRTMTKLAGVPLVDSVKMMSLTPARIAHADKYIGSLEKGKCADIILFDDDINVSMTMIDGKVCEL